MRASNDELTVVACHAMGTRFEMVGHGADPGRIRAALEAAAQEILEIHRRLSAFDPGSDITEINEQAAQRPVRVDPRTLALLLRCRALWTRTDGAFDVAVGGLMRRWGFRGEPPVTGEDSPRYGMDALTLNADASTVQWTRPGVELDLGAIAKGHALDEAADILRECGVSSALLHGGTSSVLALGRDPGGLPWRVAIRDPRSPDEALAVVELTDQALGVSAPHGRQVLADGRAMGHIMDPRSGRPSAGLRLAAVSCPSAEEADALSTAVQILGPPFADRLSSQGYRVWVVEA